MKILGHGFSHCDRLLSAVLSVTPGLAMLTGIILGESDDDCQPIYALLAFGSLSTSTAFRLSTKDFAPFISILPFRVMPSLVSPFDTTFPRNFSPFGPVFSGEPP